jgi:protein tyrosine/serine phosphatase
MNAIISASKETDPQMPRFMTREEFETEKGRRRAWHSLMVEDHGALRKIYDNSHRIAPDMWRTYQPSPQDIAKWASRGIRTVINLRGLRNVKGGGRVAEAQPGFYWLEREACERHGIRLVDHRAWSREAPPAEFLTGLDELYQTMDYPAVLHCKSGSDRAGIAATLYLFLKEGQSLETARRQLSFRYGHVKSGKTGVLDAFFDVYAAAAARDGVAPDRAHFLDWVRNEYDRDAVTDGFRAGRIGTFITDTVLRRE